MAPIRRSGTEAVEVSTRFLKFVLALAAISALGGTLAAKVVHRSDKLDAAVTASELRDTASSLIERIQKVEAHVTAVDTSVAQLRTEVKDGQRANRAISCYLAKYPAGLCDDIHQVIQAGSMR